MNHNNYNFLRIAFAIQGLNWLGKLFKEDWPFRTKKSLIEDGKNALSHALIVFEILFILVTELVG